MNLSELHRKLVKGNKKSVYIKIPVLSFSSWLFQGILYMDTTERNFKIILDIIIFLPLFFIINNYFNLSVSLIVAIIVAHTINWIFNGQVFVLLKNLRLIKTSTNSFIRYLDNIKSEVEKESSITAAAAYGSLSREKLKETSDLDIRVIRKPGIVNGIKACIFVLKERTKSFFNGFPLDIYVLDDVLMINKHIKDEKPIIIYDPTNIFENNN